MKSYPHELSGGMKQRVIIEMRIISNSDLILADEPTGSLDRANAKRVMELLSGLHEEGRTVIVVSHDEQIKKSLGRVIEL